MAGTQTEFDNENNKRTENFSSTATMTSVTTGTYNEKNDLYNPFDHREKKNATSDGGSLAHLLKASLGTGILAMPSAIKNGGLLFGGILTILIGILCTHCVHILVRSSQVLCKRSRTPLLSFADTAGAACQMGPKPLQRLAGFATAFINAAVAAACLSGCCVYVVFVASSVKQVADYYSETDISVRLYMLMILPAFLALGQIRNLRLLIPFSMTANASIIVGFAITLYFIFQDLQPISIIMHELINVLTIISLSVADYYSETDISVRLYMLMILPAFLALGQIRNLRLLIPFSMTANASIIVGFAITLYFIFQDLQPISNVNLIAAVPQLPKFFATVLFAIEGIGAVMPVENSMKKPHHFIGCPSVLNVAMSVVVVLYTVIGVFGYIKYGEDTMGSVTLNLDTKDLLSQAVKLLLALAILFTYGLQFYIGFDVIWIAAKENLSKQYHGIAQTLLRAVVVVVTVGVAIAVPDLEPFISLIGSIFYSILGLAVPAIVETVSCWDGHLGAYKWRLWKNVLICILAMLALVFGSWISMVEIIELYE